MSLAKGEQANAKLSYAVSWAVFERRPRFQQLGPEPDHQTGGLRRADLLRRLDFQYYEHDLAQLTRVIVESYKFTKAFEAETGYAPNGWATYFVNRPEKAKKPYGLYSSGPGVSFSFDPFCSNPAEPRWRRFAEGYDKLAIKTLGGNASPIQTQWLKPGDIAIPRKLAKERFTTKYYEQFLG